MRIFICRHDSGRSPSVHRPFCVITVPFFPDGQGQPYSEQWNQLVMKCAIGNNVLQLQFFILLFSVFLRTPSHQFKY